MSSETLSRPARGVATAYLKFLFPDLRPNAEEFRLYCVEPAVELRQRVRDELHRLDVEYAPVKFLAVA